MMGVVGCTTAKKTANEGDEAFTHKNWDAAVYHYLQALAEDPENVTYKMQLTFARQRAAQKHFQNGLALRKLGRLLAARNELQMAVQLDPTHQYAEQVLENVQEEMVILSTPDGARKLEELKEQARQAKVQPPVLNPKSTAPITLNFPKPKPVKEIYNAIGKAYGFNVLFDPKLKDDRLAIELRDLTAERSLEMVMQGAGHFYKVLDERSIIIADDTPQNRREYEDLVIKTFFLSNAEVKDIDKLLRSLIEARRLSTNEQLNSITLRDTADKVAIAEKLIRINDKAKAEVLIDVEILIMASTKNSNMGTALSTYNFVFGLGEETADGGIDPIDSIFVDQIRNLSSSNWFVNVPSVLINLAKSSGEAEVLAQPQLRVTEGEKATLLIGDEVPIPVTSFNTSNTIGGSVVPITSFQYKDVGIKIEVEPRVHHNREITLDLKVEISNVGETVKVGQTEAITIGTRTITSVIRLKSGESSMLAGLIRRDKTTGVTGTPLLMDIPWLGRLFRNESITHKDIDLVLTLTPQIIRFPDITEEDLAPVWVGTESRISFSGTRPRVQSGRAPRGPFDADASERERGDTSGTDKRPYGTPASRRPTAPRRVTPPPADNQGVDLVPSGGSKSISDDESAGDVGWSDVPEFEPMTGELDPTVPPLLVGLEPSVVSLRPGQETILQVVVRGGTGSYRLPFGLSFDPNRVSIDGVRIAPGVELLRDNLDAANGWIELDILIFDGIESGQTVASLEIRALEAGPVPLVFTTTGAVTGDGRPIPVAASDGALFVNAGGQEREEP
jgi:general secretion pathway protein D